MKFIMTAMAGPQDHDNWFDGFEEGKEFEAASLDDAQVWINLQCAAAGTDSDPQYENMGPFAEETG